MRIRRNRIKAAELRDLEWIGEPLSLESLKGRVVLLHFWDYTYVSSVKSFVYLTMWHGRYADKGLQIIAIHAPQFEFGRDMDNLRRAVDYLGVPFPVANDIMMTNWDAYANRFWPAMFLIDREGYLSAYNVGEGGYFEVETTIQELLKEGHPRLVMPREMLAQPDDKTVQHRPISPSLYFSYIRARIGNDCGFKPNEIWDYAIPGSPKRDIQYVEGRFLCRPDSMEFAGGRDGRVIVDYDAGDVFLVATPPEDGQPGVIVVNQDGKTVEIDAGDAMTHEDGQSRVIIERPDVYHIIHNHTCSRHRLELVIKTPGVALYCIDFMRCD